MRAAGRQQLRPYSAAAQSQLRELLGQQLSGIQEAGTFKAERIITSSQSTQITVQGSDQKILNFCANNYLGLAVSLRMREDRVTLLMGMFNV